MTELSPAMLVAMANANRTLLDGTTAPVRQIIESNDVVVAVWQDFDQPLGMGTLIIKGAAMLRNISANNAGVRCRVTAVPSDSYEQAVALLKVLGEGELLN
ncbi:hypothetical protein JQ582_34765 [Bradyrhizobium japonicum]|uniref:hypothetical protein n=1 Tax=Bradyrhizobium japonicum TaxID=375 RepID=UPI001BA66396|nr:hypothetical protein [Bradyrhizobium japonicum]MBR0749106.1 hypothetical protein [Bradyrhizobium japonicum]